MNHYTYFLTAKEPHQSMKYYIGVRSCKVNPQEDKYFGSSKLMKSLKVQSTKQILAVWATRKEALDHEILLHDCFDVARNKEFFNQAKATSTFFDVTGIVRDDNFRQKLKNRMKNQVMSKETREKISLTKKGKEAKNKGVPMTEEAKLKISAKLKGRVSPRKGVVLSQETKDKISQKKMGHKGYWTGKKRNPKTML